MRSSVMFALKMISNWCGKNQESKMTPLQQIAVAPREAPHQQIAIDYSADDPLASSIKRKLAQVPYQSTNSKRQMTIFRLPSHVRERNRNYYEPRMVSIGPYHRSRKDLKFMEEQKLRYLNQMLDENPDTRLNDYLDELRRLEPEARRCYYENTEMSSDEFIEMLLYDACFIIQLTVNWSYPHNDIVPTVSWNVPLIKTDLLMLENQLPLFVLQRVFELYSSRDDDASELISPSSDNSGDTNFDKASLSDDSEPEKASLYDVLVNFLKHRDEEFTVPEQMNSYDHLLDFYYQCFMRIQDFTTKPKKKFPLISSFKKLTMRRRLRMIASSQRKPRMIPCATELQEAGITFRKTDTNSIFSVNFSGGVLSMPYSSVEEARRPQIMNLIAFEQCSGQKEEPLTSYAVFMDCIVNTQRDVLILQQNGILENKLDDEKEAADFFNQLRYCTYLDYENHYLAPLFIKVKEYCDSNWQKHRARLCRDYFSNPWSTISFLGAIILLILALVQTFFTVFAYFKPLSH